MESLILGGLKLGEDLVRHILIDLLSAIWDDSSSYILAFWQATFPYHKVYKPYLGSLSHAKWLSE